MAASRSPLRSFREAAPFSSQEFSYDFSSNFVDLLARVTANSVMHARLAIGGMSNADLTGRDQDSPPSPPRGELHSRGSEMRANDARERAPLPPCPPRLTRSSEVPAEKGNWPFGGVQFAT